MTDPNTSSFLLEGFGDFYYELNYTDPFNDIFIIDKSTLACRTTPLSLVVTVVLCVFYILVFLLAVPGNLVVGLVIGSSRHALSPSDLYLLHLALADILLAVTLPFWAISVTQGWVFGDVICKIVSLLQEVSFYSSILFLACISVDRYLVIVRAKEARRFNRRLVSWGACTFIWVLGGFLSLPALYNSAFLPPGGQDERGVVCAEHYDPGSAEEWRLATRGLRQTLGFLLPLVVMLVCYGVTVGRLLRTRGGFQRQRAMRVIVAVVVAFLLCWMPYHLTVMVDNLLRAKLLEHGCGARAAVDRAILATQSLGLLHSCVNPLLYAFIGEKFRRRLVQRLQRTRVMGRTSVTRASRSTSLTSEATSTLM